MGIAMTAHFYLREHGQIHCGVAQQRSLDEISLHLADFQYLQQLNGAHTPYEHQKAIFLPRKAEQLVSQSWVGLIETPSGTVLELLPKIAQLDDVHALRRCLYRWIHLASGLKNKAVAQANLMAQTGHIQDWLYADFLHALQPLWQMGSPPSYQSQQQDERFLRGKLQLSHYLQQGPAKQHIFPVEQDLLSVDDVAHRLIKTALLQMMQRCKNLTLRQQTQQALKQLNMVGCSQQVQYDLQRWPRHHFWQQHRSIFQYCQQILQQQHAHAMHGQQRGHSYLFAMEQLFEQGIGHALSQQILPHLRCDQQHQGRFLAHYQQQALFKLRPDFVLHDADRACLVLDAKWKQRKSALQRSDVYQMYAYSQSYQTDVVLIYPQHQAFEPMLAPIQFQAPAQQRLWVLAFDLIEQKFCLDPQQHQALLAYFQVA